MGGTGKAVKIKVKAKKDALARPLIKGKFKTRPSVLISKKDKARKSDKLKSKSNEERKRRVNIDAWDSGVSERLEEKQTRDADKAKRIKFEPAPASFTLPTREEHLRSQFGEFAGP